MEVASAALSGALKVGIQVVVGRKRPVLEIYPQLQNDFAPPVDIPLEDSNGNVVRTDQHRRQEISIGLTLVNIGAERAEDVAFSVSGEFRRREPMHALPERFNSRIAQFAPGQTLFLMGMDEFDLLIYEPENRGNPNALKPSGVKSDLLKITMEYDGPKTLLNGVLRFLWGLFGKRQYRTEFVFDPAMFIGDLPPPTYR